MEKMLNNFRTWFYSSTISIRSVVILSCGLIIGLMLGTKLPDSLPGFAGYLNTKSSASDIARLNLVKERINEISNGSSIDTEMPVPEDAEVVSTIALPDIKRFDARKLDVPIWDKNAFFAWMTKNRNEKIEHLEQRWELSRQYIKSGELVGNANITAFLLTPREKFVRSANYNRAYDDTWLPIGYGATITDPDVVAMMTTSLDVKPDHRVLEIGTGSGYQSALLSNLSNSVFTIEVIEPLQEETDNLYKTLEAEYPNCRNIVRKLGDGFYGWEKYAPFDRIIVTCSIDHIPPPLLKQLTPNGIMIVPLGPPGRQYIMEIKKTTDTSGDVAVARRDVYNGMAVKFIPFRDEAGISYSKSQGPESTEAIE